MNELIINPKTHVIITFTKSHHFITQKQYDWLINQGGGIKFTIDGNELRTNNIAEILTVQKYYETYPDKEPKNYGQPYSEQKPVTFDGVMTTAKRLRRLDCLLAGLRRTAAENNPLLKKAELWSAAVRQGKTPAAVDKKIYIPKFRYEKEGEGEKAKFFLKPIVN